MSYKLVTMVLTNAPRDLRAFDRLVLVVLAEAARDADNSARFASAEWIAERAGSSAGNVRHALHRLAKVGLIIPLINPRPISRPQQWELAKLEQHHRSMATRVGPDT